MKRPTNTVRRYSSLPASARGKRCPPCKYFLYIHNCHSTPMTCHLSLWLLTYRSIQSHTAKWWFKKIQAERPSRYTQHHSNSRDRRPIVLQNCCPNGCNLTTTVRLRMAMHANPAEGFVLKMFTTAPLVRSLPQSDTPRQKHDSRVDTIETLTVTPAM